MPQFSARMAGKCVLIGVVAGMRSMMAPAIVVNDIAIRRPDVPMMRFLGLLVSSKSRNAALFNSTGELIYDKLPFARSRTMTGSVVFRILSGGFAGGALAASRSYSAMTGGLFGIAGVLIGTYGGYHARKWLGEQTRLPDPLIGLGEDIVALAAGKAATATHD
jgi:uncharacterized membrane protein